MIFVKKTSKQTKKTNKDSSEDFNFKIVNQIEKRKYSRANIDSLRPINFMAQIFNLNQ